MSGGSLRSLRDEALEQQRHARRVDLGDAQAVADRGVGRRAAALAEDVARAREAHDVVHGEEVRLVASSAISASSCSIAWRGRAGHARAASGGGRPPRELAQPARGRVSVRARSRAGIRSAARRARTCNARRCRASPASSSGGCNSAMRAIGRRWRSPFGIQRAARLLDRGAESRCGQHVLQRATAARVHVHVAGRDERQARARGRAPAARSSRRRSRPVVSSSTAIQSLSGNSSCEPTSLGLFRRGARQPQAEHAREARGGRRCGPARSRRGRGGSDDTRPCAPRAGRA